MMTCPKRFFLAFLAVLFACTSTPEPSPPPSKTGPQRIVSLIPSVTELLFAVGAGPRVVGVTVFCDYPEAAKSLVKVGDATPNYAVLTGLNPDLVVYDSSINKPNSVKKLVELGIPIFELKCERMADIPEALRKLGKRTGLEAEGEKAALLFGERLKEIQPLPEPPRVFLEVWSKPILTAGSQTMLDDVLKTLGAKNIYDDQKKYFQVVDASLVKRAPEIILLPVDPNSDSPEPESAAAALLESVGLEVRVIKIDSNLVTKPTPRVLEGLIQLRQALLRGP